MKIELYCPYAIWFWTTINTKSAISVVNDKYRYEIFNRTTGERIYMDYSVSLSKAKDQVFKHLNF